MGYGELEDQRIAELEDAVEKLTNRVFTQSADLDQERATNAELIGKVDVLTLELQKLCIALAVQGDMAEMALTEDVPQIETQLVGSRTVGQIAQSIVIECAAVRS